MLDMFRKRPYKWGVIMQIDDVIRNADLVRTENYQTTPPVNVYDIARNNGLEIIEKAFPQDQANISGFVTMQDGTGKLYVNLADAPNRRRFTVAHELGHWRLHKEELRNNPQRSILFRIAIGQLNKDPIEKDANIFAANLLVPLELLRQYRDGKTNEQLGELFGVSTEVIGYRLSLLEREPNVRTQEDSQN
jgi:Zn-dependent peptidase ImmA (M78 family)